MMGDGVESPTADVASKKQLGKRERAQARKAAAKQAKKAKAARKSGAEAMESPPAGGAVAGVR